MARRIVRWWRRQMKRCPWCRRKLVFAGRPTLELLQRSYCRCYCPQAHYAEEKLGGGGILIYQKDGEALPFIAESLGLLDAPPKYRPRRRRPKND